MLRKSFTGTWLPAFVAESSISLSVLLMICSIVQSTTSGYDTSMLNGLNILPSYTNYFELSPATTGLNTASVFMGGFFGPFVAGIMADRLGRRPTIFWGSTLALVGSILQGSAQNIAMFVVGRIVLGCGSSISGIAGGVYLSETFASRWRAWGVGLLNDFYYVGALLAAGITLGTGEWQSTWAWRAPSLFQGVFSLVCVCILPFVPESPRWLVHEGHIEAARISIAQANADGDISHAVVLTIHREIVDNLTWSLNEHGKVMSPKQILKDPVARRRLMIGASVGPFACIAGNIIASYYLGAELDSAGVTDPKEQLKANVVLNAWCLVCALAGTHLTSVWGRKSTALLSEFLLITCLFIIGGLSKVYADDPVNATKGLVYGNVAVMFLFQGFYSIAWTPLLFIYPSEIFNYAMRANGQAASNWLLNAFAILFVFIMPIGLHNISWKMYMINGSWDVLILVFIAVFWVETKGKTLEEIDAIFEGTKHSNVPDVEDVRKGKVSMDIDVVEQECITTK